MTQKEWQDQLQLADFTGLHVAVGALDTYGEAKLSIMVSTKRGAPTASTPLERAILIKPTSASVAVDTLVSAVSQRLAGFRVNIEVKSLEDASAMAAEGQLSQPGICVVPLFETEGGVFARCSEPVFEGVRNLIIHSQRLVWITCNASAHGIREPGSCAISGLFRTVRSENPRLSCTSCI